MAAKTLSTSTLSLKFMQNAHRAKNLAEVQLDRAEVKDDGEWEVAKEIRDAWGPETAQVYPNFRVENTRLTSPFFLNTRQSVSYEASYLPFLFTPDASGSNAPPAANLKGRRAFKRGREVTDEYQVIVPVVPATEAKPPTTSTSKAGKPKQISSLGGRPGSNTNSKKTANAPKGKSARQAIYDNTGVGADLRSQKVDPSGTSAENNSTPPPPPPNVFLKPSGVDEPAESTKSGLASTSADVVTPHSTERKSKGKREREQTAENVESESGKKRKKKKKNDQVAAVE
ncbi:hypothetical protein B0H12DRAFT_1201857 [Mycena haematopus]|nr:hypothetical protein B0H12DRAFT_1201857 [Mycena haematopus]